MLATLAQRCLLTGRCVPLARAQSLEVGSGHGHRQDDGLHVAHVTGPRILPLLADDPSLLVTPLVRNGSQLTVGLAETAWKEWVK